MSDWKPKISSFGPLQRGRVYPCGVCGEPIVKGQERSVVLWMRGEEGCTTRRHAGCEEGHAPSEAEIETHATNQKSKP